MNDHRVEMLETIQVISDEITQSLIGPLTIIDGVPFMVLPSEDHHHVHYQELTDADAAMLFSAIRSKGQNDTTR